MPEPYNLTGLYSANNVFELFDFANNQILGNSMLGTIILVGFFFIALVTLLKSNDPSKSFTVASFLTSIIGLGFVMIGFINVSIYIILLVITAGGWIAMYFAKDNQL